MVNSGSRNGSQNGTGAVAGQQAATVPANDNELAWDSLSPAVTRELDKPLDPAVVSERKGRKGRRFSYLEGHIVIHQANEIFGRGGWGYELAGDVTLREIEQIDPETGEVRRAYGYSTPVRVTVPGAPPRTDIGFHAVVENDADGHDTAIKASVTDGMKRALRSFGDRFGNGLYGDQPGTAGQAVGKVPSPAPSTEALEPSLRATIFELGALQGFDADQVRAAIRAKEKKEIDELTAAELTPLVEAATRKLRETQETQAEAA